MVVVTPAVMTGTIFGLGMVLPEGPDNRACGSAAEA